jgi:hypothetical protein
VSLTCWSPEPNSGTRRRPPSVQPGIHDGEIPCHGRMADRLPGIHDHIEGFGPGHDAVGGRGDRRGHGRRASGDWPGDRLRWGTRRRVAPPLRPERRTLGRNGRQHGTVCHRPRTSAVEGGGRLGPGVDDEVFLRERQARDGEDPKSRQEDENPHDSFNYAPAASSGQAQTSGAASRG